MGGADEVTHTHLTASRDQMGRCDWLQVAMTPEVMSWDCHILSTLAISPWVGTMSTDGGLGHRQGRNGEFWVTVALYQGCCILA